MACLGTDGCGFGVQPGGQLGDTLAQGPHLIVGEGVDAARPVQPQQRGVQPLAEPGGTGQRLRHLVRSRRRWCWLVSRGSNHPSGIAETGHGFAGDGFRASDKGRHLLGLNFMQAAEFVERARGFAAPVPECLVEHRWQAEQGQMVCHRGEVHAQLATDLGVGFAGVHPAPDELRQFKRAWMAARQRRLPKRIR